MLQSGSRRARQLAVNKLSERNQIKLVDVYRRDDMKVVESLAADSLCS